MKRQIRRGVFESNSSSQHSLVVMKKNDHYTPEEIKEEFYLGEHGVWDVWDNSLDFGRSPFRTLGTFKTKWLYACASLVEEYNDDAYKELEALAFKYVPGLKKIELPMTTVGIFNKDFEANKNDEFAQKHGKLSLEEYLTNRKYIIIQDGDEYCYWQDMKNAGLVNSDAIDHEYPDY